MLKAVQKRFGGDDQMKPHNAVAKHTISLGLLLLSTAATAQTSVSLWGRVDAGVQYLTNVAGANGQRSNLLSAESGDDGASSLGISGTEDIGDGYKINFKLLDYLQVINGGNSTPF